MNTSPQRGQRETIEIVPGKFLFEFPSFQRWVSKASSWYGHCGSRSEETIAIDKLGRICTHGKQFMRARDENTFPVRVYRKTTD